MRYPSPTLDGFDALWDHPIHWFKRQFVFYLIVSVASAVAFVVGAAVYSYLLRSPDATPAPDRKPNVPIERLIPF